MKTHKHLRLLATATAALVLTLTARGQTVLIDFANNSSYRGVSVSNPDVNGHYWNSVWSGAYYPALVDLSGSPTSMKLGFDSATGTDYYNGPSGAIQDPNAVVINAATLGNLGVNQAVYDYYVSSSFQIQGLDPAKTYDLTLFGSHKYNTDNVTRYGIYTDATYATRITYADLTVGINGAHNQDTVATLNGVSPQANGIIYLKFLGSNGSLGYLNDMQISLVPEPSTVALIGLGLACFIARRRRA